MANPVRGEVDFTHDGKTYRVRVSMNDICEIEQSLGKTIEQVMTRPGVFELRELLWYGLRGAHPEMTREQAGDLLGLAAEEASDAVMRSMRVTAPVLFRNKGDAAAPLEARRRKASA